MSKFNNKVLITGGAGFIGSHVAARFLEDGTSVTVLDDFNDFYDPAIKERNIGSLGAGLNVERGDLRDIDFVSGVFERGGFDSVVHLAARAGVRPSLENPRVYVSTNVDGTLNILEECRNHGVKNVVFASSSSVYGVNKKVPFAEDDLISRTISPYAATKLMGEQLCSNYSNLYGIRCICLRFFTVYGPRQRPDLAIAKFIDKILRDEVIDQYGNGSTARDYTYIDDIVSGVMAAACYKGAEFDIFNLGGSETHTLANLISTIEATVGKSARINFLPEQPGDVPLTYADISKSRKLLGYEPHTSLEAGIRKYFDWLKGSY